VSIDKHPQSTEILTALGINRPGAYVEAAPDRRGNFLIVEVTEDSADTGDAILGVAMPEVDGWDLGCMTCGDGLDIADAGMCEPCREDAAWQDQQEADAAWAEAHQ
jgi:hypothetical protein